MKRKKIGLDIDGVLADFMLAWHKLHPEIPSKPNSYDYDKNINQRLIDIGKTGKLNDFYLNIKPFIEAKDLPFEPSCYITARPVDSSITEKWLKLHGFPTKPVITVGISISKIDAVKENDVDIFIDDHYENFIDLNKAGIICYLYTASWNIKYDVGNMRLDSLKDLSLFHPALTD
ncbi:MAG: hypothetical protein PF487_14755 [Bacteroidales bacterium]|jgi:uncharacterized HAD superfamily protein|nr:hypothetical protein [Bacteroidales bacterium]